MNKRNLVLILPCLSFTWLLLTVLIGGMTYPGYDHFSQFISELAASGAPYGFLVNYLGFIPTEMFILLFFALAYTLVPKSILMRLGVASLVMYAIALCVAAVFPCDFECRPVEPSVSHSIHILSGTIAYFFAMIGIVLLAIASNKWPDAKIVNRAGWAVGLITFVLLLNLEPDSGVRGLVQRIIELVIYIWFILLALYLYKSAD